MILMALAEFLSAGRVFPVHAANLKSGYAAVEAHTPDLAIMISTCRTVTHSNF